MVIEKLSMLELVRQLSEIICLEDLVYDAREKAYKADPNWKGENYWDHPMVLHYATIVAEIRKRIEQGE